VRFRSELAEKNISLTERGRREAISIRDAVTDDVPVLVAFDLNLVVLRGDNTRAMWLRDHVRAGVVRVAELGTEAVGYCAVEESFFQQPFVELLIVAERARRKGMGAHLLCDTLPRCQTSKLWTSTNFSNLPMQRSLSSLDGSLPGSCTDWTKETQN
jgi:hypothetical protein